jgi:hypothetical protein
MLVRMTPGQRSVLVREPANSGGDLQGGHGRRAAPTCRQRREKRLKSKRISPGNRALTRCSGVSMTAAGFQSGR